MNLKSRTVLIIALSLLIVSAISLVATNSEALAVNWNSEKLMLASVNWNGPLDDAIASVNWNGPLDDAIASVNWNGPQDDAVASVNWNGPQDDAIASVNWNGPQDNTTG